jgi:hypothetical protein
MFIVSGTKRSGTSMWMQALAAAGLDVMGEKFPKNWQNGALRDANPDGFFEGMYRDGIFFGTNPHPATGAYLRPEDVRDKITKVFVPGVIRTERAFLDGVIANVRSWREYEASVDRLWALDEAQRMQDEPDQPSEIRVPAALEWWTENFGLLKDHHLRGYPLQIQTYDQVLRDPEKYIGRALQALGGGDLEAAVQAIKPENRTQEEVESSSVEPRIAEAFDELFHAVETEAPFHDGLVRKLVAIDDEIRPQLTEIKVARARTLLEGRRRFPPFFMLAATLG